MSIGFLTPRCKNDEDFFLIGVAIAIGRDDGLMSGVVLGDATLNCFLCLLTSLFPMFSLSVDVSRDNCSVLVIVKESIEEKKS